MPAYFPLVLLLVGALVGLMAGLLGGAQDSGALASERRS
jgi:hypothetical protein